LGLRHPVVKIRLPHCLWGPEETANSRFKATQGVPPGPRPRVAARVATEPTPAPKADLLLPPPVMAHGHDLDPAVRRAEPARHHPARQADDDRSEDRRPQAVDDEAR